MSQINHFKEAAKSWDSEVAVARNRGYAQAVEKHLPALDRPLRFLDFGCGTGLLSEHFAVEAESLLGVDSTPEMLEVFDTRFKELAQVRSLAVNLEENPQGLKGQEFDVIFTAMAFHHLREPKIVLNLLKEHLSPQGRIMIVDLDKEDGSFHPDPKAMGVHHFGFSSEQWQVWAQDLDFALCTQELIEPIEKNNRAYPVRLVVYGH